MRTFDWKTQLKVGDRGQELLLENYPEPLVVYPKHKADFRRLSDGALIELKTDTYNLEHTSNLFMERWGDLEQTKPAGPWRSRRDRVPVFIYYFVRHNLWLEWDTKELCKRLDKITKKDKLIPVKSNHWIVLGYKVPISSVIDLAKIHYFTTETVDGRIEYTKYLIAE